MQNVERRAACSDAAVHWRTGKIPRPDRPIRASTAMMAQRTLEARPCRWCREILLPMGRNRGSLTKSKFRRDFKAVEGAGDWTAGVGRGPHAGRALPTPSWIGVVAHGNATV